MHKTRIISAVIGSILLIGVVLSGQVVFGAAVFLLAVVGVYEFNNAMLSGGYKPIRFVGYISCIPLLTAGMNGVYIHIDFADSIKWIAMGVYLLVVLLLAVIIFKHEKYQITDIAVTLFGISYVVYMFLFMILTRNLPNGFWLIWFIFIGAFVTDTFAYFAGVRFGKRKILPAVSPKKSLEGAIGGVVGCLTITLLYGMYLKNIGVLNNIAIFQLIILGLVNGTVSQIGDWAASAIKRYVKIKDYGKIMPGHGGVLDRFDSILFIAPVVYFYFSYIIL